MSLTRPTLLSLTSFDATKDKAFYFNVEAGGSQIVANKLTVRDQESDQIVYEQKQETFKYEHILPANSLENGKYYNAVLTVFDVSGEESAPSAPVQFRCYTTPVLRFTNFPETAIINNASYEFKFTYDQAEGERLNSYVVNLYDISQGLISSSGESYVRDGTPPFSASYLFTGFIDDTVYFVEVVGETIDGALVTTGKLRFNVDYKQPDLFTLLELENNCDEGYITVSSNIVLIDAEVNPDPPIYIDGKEIDLSGEDSYLKWPEGYTVNGDFIVRAWLRKPTDYSTILKFSNISGQTIEVKFMKGYENVDSAELKSYVQVAVASISGIEYYIQSAYIEPIPDDAYYNLQLRRVNNIYQVELIDMRKEGA